MQFKTDEVKQKRYKSEIVKKKRFVVNCIAEGHAFLASYIVVIKLICRYCMILEPSHLLKK